MSKKIKKTMSQSKYFSAPNENNRIISPIDISSLYPFSNTKAAENVKTEKIEVPSVEEQSVIEQPKEDKPTEVKEKHSEADKYYENKIKEADEYYESKKNEADSLKANEESRINGAIEKAKKKAAEEARQNNANLIKKAKEEAKLIVEEAKEDIDAKSAELAEREKKLSENERDFLKHQAELDVNKLNYKHEIYETISSELDSIKKDAEELRKDNEKLKSELSKKEKDIDDLKNINKVYADTINDNRNAKKDVLNYQQKLIEADTTIQVYEEQLSNTRNELEKQKRMFLSYGDDPAKAMQENVDLKKQLRELNDRVANIPSVEELNDLRKIKSNYDDVINQLNQLKSENNNLINENAQNSTNKNDIENYRLSIKMLSVQNEELRQELKRNLSLYQSSNQKVFPTLSEIDKEKIANYSELKHKPTLKEICVNFRSYLATRSENPLYYTDQQIRTFIAGFAASRLTILEGLSGTGKSSLPKAFQDYIGAVTDMVPVQSSWKDRNDLLGFYNDFKKQYKETTFLKALYRASHDNNRIHLIVLDEMNLSRIEYYFADLLSVLEDSKEDNWKIELVSDYSSITQNVDVWPKLIHEGKLQISPNTWFIGTANKDDSTFTITDKVYDRAVVLNFESKGVKADGLSSTKPTQMSSNDFLNLLKSSSKFKNGEDKEYYHNILDFLNKNIIDLFKITFGNRIENQLNSFVPAYVACGGTLEEALDIMFSRKVLRKLDGFYDDESKRNMELLKESIQDRYQDKFPISVATLDGMMNRIG